MIADKRSARLRLRIFTIKLYSLKFGDNSDGSNVPFAEPFQAPNLKLSRFSLSLLPYIIDLSFI